ncbi:MAG: tetratricopeptide repeat protein [Armatimonadota bacterium]|nr:tetratricopeptide repeat protein [Armatimonadota bacterium]
MARRPDAIGDFTVRRLLGTGRHGRTWLAVGPDGRQAALREIECHGTPEADAVRTDPALKRLTRVMSGISHTGIAENLDVLRLGTRVYVAEEYVELPPLVQVLAQEGTLPVEEAWAIGCQILSALEFGHLRGLLHLDVRPDNVHYDRRFRQVVLTDFGHMQLLLGLRTGLTLASIADEYHPPEVHAGAEPAITSEIFSVGATIHELLTGVLPDRPDLEPPQGGRFTFLEVERQAARRTPQELLEAVAQQAPGIVAVVRKALDAEPGKRYQRAGQMQGALARAWRADAQGERYVEESLVEEAAKPEAVAEEAERAPGGGWRAEGGVQFCEQCGRPIRPGSRVCQRCGTPRTRRGRVVSLPPQRREPQTYFQRHGDRLLVEERFAEAEEAYRMAAQRAPDDAEVQRDLADALAINGKYAEAAAAYRRVLRDRPDDLEVRHELGRVLVADGRDREGAYELRKVLEAAPSEEMRRSAVIHLGAALAGQRRYGQARKLWLEVLEEEPRNARVAYLVATSYLGEHNEPAAQHYLQMALRADPDYGQARRALREVRLRLDRGAHRPVSSQYTRPPTDSSGTGFLADALRGASVLLGLGEPENEDRRQDAIGIDEFLRGDLPGRSIPIEDDEDEEQEGEGEP